MHVLYEQLMKHSEQVARYEEWFCRALAIDEEGECCGVVTRNIADGSMELFHAKAVILACGGNGQVWKPTTNALICTGDGIAMAYRVGAKLMDMEMIQYHPTTLAGKGFLITEGARGEGAHLLNAKGERFMERYAPNKMELASRDVVSRAEQTEINEGAAFPTAPSPSTSPWFRKSASTRRCARSSSSAATSPASTSPGNRSTSSPATTTRWAASRPTSRAGPTSPASTRRARRPASRSTAATGSAPTPCSTR